MKSFRRIPIFEQLEQKRLLAADTAEHNCAGISEETEPLLVARVSAGEAASADLEFQSASSADEAHEDDDDIDENEADDEQGSDDSSDDDDDTNVEQGSEEDDNETSDEDADDDSDDDDTDMDMSEDDEADNDEDDNTDVDMSETDDDDLDEGDDDNTDMDMSDDDEADDEDDDGTDMDMSEMDDNDSDDDDTDMDEETDDDMTSTNPPAAVTGQLQSSGAEVEARSSGDTETALRVPAFVTVGTPQNAEIVAQPSSVAPTPADLLLAVLETGDPDEPESTEFVGASDELDAAPEEQEGYGVLGDTDDNFAQRDLS